MSNIKINYISCSNVPKGFKCNVEKVSDKGGTEVWRFSLKSETSKPMPVTPITVKFFAPAIEFFSQWSPLRDFERSLLPNWGRYLPNSESRLVFGAPLQCFIGQDGKNKVCVSVSDVKTPQNR